DRIGGGFDLLLAFDRARSRDHRDSLAADLHAANFDYRSFRAYLARRQLERPHHRHHALAPSHGLEMRQLMLLAALIADTRDHGALDAADNVRVVIEFLDHPGYGLNLGFSGMRFHYDNQVMNPLR